MYDLNYQTRPFTYNAFVYIFCRARLSNGKLVQILWLRHNETTTLHFIYLKIFPFQKCKQKILYEEGLLSIESSYLKIGWPQRSTMLKNVKNVKKNVKKSAFAFPYFQSCYIELCAYNENNKSGERFVLSTIYGAANFRIQYICGLHTAVEVGRLVRGTVFDS